MKNFLPVLISVSLYLMPTAMISQTDFYWVGGSGDWTDLTHWAKDAAGVNPTGVLPDGDAVVHITDQSHTGNMWTILIPPGDHHAESILAETNKNFRLLFDGSSGNYASMTIHRHLELLPTHRLEYTDPSAFHNGWIFEGGGDHNIYAQDLDLSSIEFLTASGTYNQLTDFEVSERIRLHAGTWHTNGFDIEAGNLLFQGIGGSSSQETKIFNAGTSDIYCEQWNSKFSYQTLTVTGDYTIFTRQFQGTAGNQSLSFHFNNIHLLNFADNTDGSSSQIEHNNFDCAYCDVDELVIKDTSAVQLAGIFTINDLLEVKNLGTRVLFNGGNSFEDEVIINGDIITPKVVNCDDTRTVFSNIFCDFTTLTRTAGALSIADSEINNIQASGGATFSTLNSVLQGSSSGWIEQDIPTAIEYYWIGISDVYGDWDDPANWQLSNGGSNGCIPNITDNVFITDDAKGPIRIPSPYKAKCNNLIWTNTQTEELFLDGQVANESELIIAGSLMLDESATITTNQNHELVFSSTHMNTIETNKVQLPDIYFVGDVGSWTLLDELSCDRITVQGGTLTTQGYDITTDRWLSIDENPKHFDLAGSTITVNGTMSLAPLPTNNVTVDIGSSRIVCEQLESAVPILNDVEMINTSNVVMSNWPVTFDKLILSGTGHVQTSHHMTLNDLIFDADNSKLRISPSWDFIINDGILSNAAKVSPARLSSTIIGVQAQIDKPIGNLCIVGHHTIQDIEAVVSGVTNAPLSLDNGNNTDIDFGGGTGSDALYWIGGTDDRWNTRANWSRISGGCPTTFNPATAPNLVFDENSFTDAVNSVVMTSTTTIANDIHFRNEEDLTVVVLNNFVPQNITVSSSGLTRLEGPLTEVQGTTLMEPGSVLITDVDDFYTFYFVAEAPSAWILSSGTTATVVEP